MKVVTLSQDQLLDGRLRRKGEVITVDDSFIYVDKVIQADIEKMEQTQLATHTQRLKPPKDDDEPPKDDENPRPPKEVKSAPGK